MRKLAALWGRIRRRPFDAACVALALATSIYVVAAPFAVARYPMMTDVPFHAASAAVLAHYDEPSWHFQEQFVLQPLRVPYLSMYAVAAALMHFMSAVSAIKVAAVLMLALLPAGLAVLAWGMRKSPLLGLLGLGVVWGGLSSWGFLNFLGALGLFAAALGVALRQLDRPRRHTGWTLSALLVLILCTHPFRFPFAVAAVLASALSMWPAARRARPVLWPLALPLALFGAWLVARPPALAAEMGELSFHPERLANAAGHLYRSLRDPEEARSIGRAVTITGWVGAALAIVFVIEGRLRRGRIAWGLGATAVVLGSAAVFLLMYLVLPMQIGIWWYVYPREITSAVYLALAALPDLPRARLLRLAFVALLCAAALPLGRVVVGAWRDFDVATRDYTAIVAHIPRAPKLLYLVFDHGGSRALGTPFLHLPAYVQAEKGGWLSFHFAAWGTAPIAYRSPDEPGAVVPPPTPLRWEWTPQRFELKRHGAFFDWFLVRARSSPARLFAGDASIEPVAQQGRWWLYRRIR